MKMKIPNSGSGNGYYGHDSSIITYMDNNIDIEPEVQATGDGDFSEYLWMENEEEFDKQVLDIQYEIFQKFFISWNFAIGTPTIRRGRVDGGMSRSNVGRGEAT